MKALKKSAREISTGVGNAIQSTKGYKTKTGAVIYILVLLFGKKVPFLVENKENIMVAVDLLFASGLLHDIWMNRNKIKEFFLNIFKKKS